MAIFKCKMCGGQLEITQGTTVCTCEYCGTEQTLPKLDSDKKTNLYDRADHFRRNNDYDRAMTIYNQILDEDNTDAESYWSLVLCRYGIEYVEDPATHKRIPTINRAQYTSIYADENYKSAIEYADSLQKTVYENEAKIIDEIQKKILAISQKEEPFDVFICYKETDENGRRTRDSVLANDLYHQLTQEGFKVFFAKITLEDKLGEEYEPYIFAAINSAKVMVVLGTKPEYFKAVWVKNEWARYLALIGNGAKKMLIPAYKDMDPYDLPDEFSHLQAQDMGKLGFMQDLIRGIKKILNAGQEVVTGVNGSATGQAAEQLTGNVSYVTSGISSNIVALLKRGNMALEDEEWEKADGFFDEVLNQEAECAEAYLGKMMVELEVPGREYLRYKIEPFDHSKNFQKIMRFGNEEIKTEMKNDICFIRYQKAVQLEKNGNYEKAISCWKEIKDYKDSSERIENCVKEIKKIDNIIMAIENRNHSNIDQLRQKANQLGVQKKSQEEYLARITALESSLPGMEQEYLSLEKKKEQIIQRREQLWAEKASLGIFSGKRKKEIYEEVVRCGEEIGSVEEQLKIQQGKMQGYNSQTLKNRLQDTREKINQIDQEIQNNEQEIRKIESEEKNGINYEMALKELQNTNVLIALQNKNPDFYKELLANSKRMYEIAKQMDIHDCKDRDVVIMGEYKKQPIIWRVLKRIGNKILLLSEFGLDAIPYNVNREDTTWEKCSLRGWLNHDFYKSSFSEKEKRMIEKTYVSADRNPEWETNPGKATQDYLFLLSIVQIEKYLKYYKERICYETTALGNGACDWWLRSPGYNSLFAAYVKSSGNVYERGDGVSRVALAVRPALIINLDS